MTKADIVNEISKTTGIEKANVLDTIEKFMEIVKDSIAHGEAHSHPIGTIGKREIWNPRGNHQRCQRRRHR